MILGIESSCDESALALFDPEAGLCGEWVHSQVALHQTYGGVVPDLASREHVSRLVALLERAAAEAAYQAVQKIAVTAGPGLAGCLAVGMAQAQALALAHRVALIPVNHLRAHAFSVFIPTHAKAPSAFAESLRELLPHLGLLVSGGNTVLFAIDRDRSVTVIGQTVDDAAGEALDKGAKLLGLAYPGGPLIEAQARSGDPGRFRFPTGVAETGDRRFSFSGLKTSLRYRLEKMSDAEVSAALPDLCASYQQAVVAQLTRKAREALRAAPYRSIGLSGGVANNEPLRTAMARLAANANVPLLAAEQRHTGDNAAMVAFAAMADPAAQPRNGTRLFPAATVTDPF